MVPEPAARTIHTNHLPAGNETWWSSLASHLVPLFPASKPSFLLYLNLSRGDVFHHDSKFIRIHGNQRLSELGLSGDKDGLDFSSRSDAAIDGELNWFIKTESWIRIGRRVRRRKQAVYKGRLGKSVYPLSCRHSLCLDCQRRHANQATEQQRAQAELEQQITFHRINIVAMTRGVGGSAGRSFQRRS